MLLELKAAPKLLAVGAALLGSLSAPLASGAEPPSAVEAQYRGCDSAGWCRFWIEPSSPLADPMLRVRPDGIARMSGDDATSIAVRDRLNALLASMIHQHKHIVLHDLRALEGGTYSAAVTVNGMNLEADPILQELR